MLTVGFSVEPRLSRQRQVHVVARRPARTRRCCRSPRTPTALTVLASIPLPGAPFRVTRVGCCVRETHLDGVLPVRHVPLALVLAQGRTPMPVRTRGSRSARSGSSVSTVIRLVPRISYEERHAGIVHSYTRLQAHVVCRLLRRRRTGHRSFQARVYCHSASVVLSGRQRISSTDGHLHSFVTASDNPIRNRVKFLPMSCQLLTTSAWGWGGNPNLAAQERCSSTIWPLNFWCRQSSLRWGCHPHPPMTSR